MGWATEATAIEPNQVVSFELTLSNSGPDDGQEVQLTVLPVADGWFEAGPDVPAGGSPLLQTVIPLVPAGQTLTIPFQFQLTGLPANDLLLTAQVATAGQPVVESSYTLPVVRPPVEQLQIGAGQQETGQTSLSLLDNRLNLANWQEGPATLQATLHEWHNESTGRIIYFELSATRPDGSAIITFTNPISASLNLTDLLPSTALHLLTRETEAEAWSEIAFTETGGVLAFTLEHFSQFQVTSDPNPQSWLPTYNPPGVSAFTGSASYGYAISLPPAIGGLQPELSLNYGSRGVDSKASPVQGSLGWSLSTIEISNGNAGRMFAANGCETGCNVYESVWYNLVLNGVSYRLEPTDGLYQLTGLYKAVGDPSLRVELRIDTAATNRTGLYWLIQTGDGTNYRLGYRDDSELAVGPMATQWPTPPRNPNFMAATWKVDQIVDVYGRQISFFYDEACGTSGSYCRDIYGDPVTDGDEYPTVEVDLALNRIEYNFSGATPQTVVEIANSGQNNSLRGQPMIMLVNHFRPETITIKHNNQVFASYTLGYTTSSHSFDYPSGTKLSYHWWLTSITPYGQNGSPALPATTFTYLQPTRLPDITLLRTVANGYGGVNEIFYAAIDRGDWGRYHYVTALGSWDGVETRWDETVSHNLTTYSYDPLKACYDEVMENKDCKAPAGASLGSHALVGFSEVTIDYKDGLGNPLARQWQKFNIANYQLNGKLIENKQIDPANNSNLTWDLFAWQWTGSQARQTEEHHYRYGTTGGELYTYTLNSYYDGAGHYGGLYRQTSYEDDGTPFRCTEYVYAHQTNNVWLINRPLRQTSYSGNCVGGTKVAESLSRYTGSTVPTDTGLYSKAQLAWTLTWAGGTNYVAQRVRYNSNNLVEWQDSFTAYATTSAYPTTVRSALHTTNYNSLGLPLNQDTTGAGFAVLWSEQISYQAVFPWLPAAYTNPQGLTASYTFDQYGRLSTVTKAGANHVSAQYDYQLSTIPMRITATVEPNTSLEQKSVVYYNGLGQAIQSTSTNHLVESSPADIITKSGFDALNRQVCQSTPFTAAVGSGFINTPCQSQSEKSLTEYDGLGRVKKVTPPDNVPLYTYYNVLDVLTAGDFLATVTTVDGNGHANRQVLDGFGRLVGVIEYSGTADPYTTYATTQYSYDVLGNLLTVTDAAGNVTSLSYDVLGHKLTMDDPDMGDWSYAYDVYGNLAAQTDANGDKICFRYDDLNRLTEKHEDPTPGDVCPTNPTNILSRTIYGTTGTARGQIIEVQWGNSTSINRETFSYDSLGRPAAHTRWVDNRSYTLTYSNYDALNRPATITYPNGQSRTITFDKEGENSLTNSGTTLISNILYNGRGQMTFLDRTWGGVDTTYSYHPAGDTSGGGLGDSNYRLKAIQHAIGNNAWPDFSYEYDKAGNITRLTNTFTINNTPKSDTQTFTYDHLNRLLTAQATGGIANYNHTGSNNDYNYDQLGNITYLGNNTLYDYQNWSSSCTGLPTPPPEMPHAVKKIGNQYFCYDDNGNMTTRFDGTTLYDQNFNIENELESVEVNGQTTQFFYDANGIRVKTVQPNGTLIDTPFPDYEVENPGLSTQTVRITLTIAGQAVATRVVTSSTSTYYYLFADHLGSTVLMASQNSAKNQLEPVTGSRATYYPFGDYRGLPPAQTLTDRGFTGQKSNNQPAADLGLLYYNTRYYAPGIARFLSADTIVPDPTNPQAFNRFSYVLNNPLSFVDPSGHRTCTPQQTASGDETCTSPIPPSPVKFVGNFGNKEKAIITNAVEKIGVGLAQILNDRQAKLMALGEISGYTPVTSSEAFLQVYGGTITFSRVNNSCASVFGAGNSCYGSTSSPDGKTIYVYNNAYVNGQFQGDVYWATHELGHAFAKQVGQLYGSELYASNTLSLAIPNGRRLLAVNSYYGFAGRYDSIWQQSKGNGIPTADEEFADMFIGWTYGQWERNSSLGSARNNFMTTTMSQWAIALTVNH